MNLKRFFKECNNRGVFKTLSIYIVSSWVVLQVLSVVAEPLGLPEKSVTYLIIILLIGLPLYLLFLWKSKVRFAKSEQKDDVAENIQNEINFKRSYFISLGIISLFTIASVFFIINTNFTSGIKLLPSNESNKIAVMDFQNMTGVDSLNIVGEMAADWLSFGIAENEVGEVISSEVVSNYSNLLGVQLTPESSENILDRFFNPSKLVSGSYFLRDSTLIFNCRIMDGAGKTTLQAFAPVNCDMTSSLDCIENLKQEVITYLHTSQNKEVVQVLYEEDPPKFEAYKKVLQAEADYDDEDNYIKLINEAITIDSEYFYAKILKVQHHHNMGEYRLADSLIKDLKPNFTSKIQLNFYNYLKALIDGDSRKMYEYMVTDYSYAPFDISTNSSLMTLAVYYINRPDLVEDIFDDIDMADMLLENCSFCIFRYYAMGTAYNGLGDYKKAKTLLEPISVKINNSRIYNVLTQAYVKSNDSIKLLQFMDRFALTADSESLNDLNLLLGKTFLVAENSDKASNHFNAIVDNNPSNKHLAESYYYNNDFEKAEDILLNLYKEDSEDFGVISKLGVSYYKNGKVAKATELINSMENLRTAYQFGSLDYALAQYYAAIGEKDKAIESLEKSIANGYLYRITSYHNDSHFIEYLNDPKFQDVLTYWH